jgi:hypothetical protein
LEEELVKLAEDHSKSDSKEFERYEKGFKYFSNKKTQQAN